MHYLLQVNKQSVLLLAIILFYLMSFNNVHASIYTSYEPNPVLNYSNIPGTYDERRVYTPRVINVNGEYKMYFTGLNSGNNTQIGLATSSDGINWTKYSANPVFKCGENLLNTCQDNFNWSSHGVGVSSVIYENGTYKMWYFGDPKNGPSFNYLGYATSSDGINWNAYNNPLFPNYSEDNTLQGADEVNSFYPTALIKKDTTYLLYYTGGFRDKTFLATSLDGINWNKANNGESVFNDLVSSATQVNGKVLMLDLSGYLNISEDGINFTRITTERIPDYELNDDVGGAIMVEGNLIKIWKQKIVSFGSIYENINYVTTPSNILGVDNQAPIITTTASGTQNIVEGANISFIVSASDSDNNNITLSTSNLPLGSTFNPTTSVFSWTPSLSQSGLYTPLFEVTDDGVPSQSASVNVIISVEDNPTPYERSNALVANVINLNLPNNIFNSYLANLNKIAPFIQNGQIQPAINQLQAFINKVNNDYSKGYISLQVKNDLVSKANTIISDL